jgi:hypothetical protein
MVINYNTFLYYSKESKDSKDSKDSKELYRVLYNRKRVENSRRKPRKE